MEIHFIAETGIRSRVMERSRKNQNIGSSSSTPSMPVSGGGSSGGAGIGIGDGLNTGILDERVLVLLFRSINWDPHVISVAACVSRRLRAVASRVLFRELCISRAPRMVAALTSGGATPTGGRLGGGWPALAKLLFFCCGCPEQSRFFVTDRPVPGHFAAFSRFSKTSGWSFLTRRCRGDLLYVTDPCEHVADAANSGGGVEDLGTFRRVFGWFMRSRTRALLIGKRAELEMRVQCPYCGARVWSMSAAGLVPRSAARRLGSREGGLDYLVCVNGHLHGFCRLAHLSTDEEEEEDVDDDNDGGDDDEDDGDMTA